MSGNRAARSLQRLAARVEQFRAAISEGLEHTDFNQRRALVELLIDRVVVDGRKWRCATWSGSAALLAEEVYWDHAIDELYKQAIKRDLGYRLGWCAFRMRRAGCRCE